MNTIKEHVINKLRGELERVNNPDEPFIASTSGKSLTLQELIDEISSDSKIGKSFVESITNLTIDLLHRGKEEFVLPEENKTETLEEKCRRLQAEYNYRLPKGGYTILHIDGRSFGNYVKSQQFHRPFDEFFVTAMTKTAIALAEQVGNAIIAYVQSDEITVICYDQKPREPWFGGRVSKLCSIAASIATGAFRSAILHEKLESEVSDWYRQSEGRDMPVYDMMQIISSIGDPQFDCKAWFVKELNDAYAWLSFRNIDCIRNSISQVGQSEFSHKELLNKNSDDVKKMLKEIDQDWDELPDGLRYGRLIVREPIEVTTENGTAIRNKWVVRDGVEMTGPEGKAKVMPFLDR